MNQGYLYVLSNPAYQSNCLKIGLTRSNPTLRAKELSRASGVPGPFYVEHATRVRSVAIAEKRVHLLLNKNRISSGKEFFTVDMTTARRTCDCVVAFEHEDSPRSNVIHINEELVCANYSPDHSLNTRKLIYLLMSMTVGKSLFEGRVGIRRPHPVDGFIDASQIASYLRVQNDWARSLLRKLWTSAPILLCRSRNGAIVAPVFESFDCHRGHAAWRFSDHSLSLFENQKVSRASIDRVDAIGFEALFTATPTHRKHL